MSDGNVSLFPEEEIPDKEKLFQGKELAKGKCLFIFLDKDGKQIYHLSVSGADKPEHHPSVEHPYNFYRACVVEVYGVKQKKGHDVAVPAYVNFPGGVPVWHTKTHAYAYDEAQTDFFLNRNNE